MREIPVTLQSIVLIDHMADGQRNALDTLFPDHLFVKIEQTMLENDLAASFNAKSFDPVTTLLVFVGQSSRELKHRLSSKIDLSKFETVYVPAKRRYEPVELSAGRESYSIRVEVGTIERKNVYLDTDIKNIVVFDDVVSTGSTLKVLCEKNAPLYPNAAWSAFTLVSRLEKVKGYQAVYSAGFVKEKFTPINTFSKLVEDEAVREKYLLKHFWRQSHGDNVLSEYGKRVDTWLSMLKKRCLHTPHVFCFDLFNTLVYEKDTGIMEVGHEITVTIPDYLDYFVEQYGAKYQLTKADVYSYVRDKLMTMQCESFEEMTQLLYAHFIPNEECMTRKKDSHANNVEWAWRARSGSAEWMDISIPFKLKLLKSLGHKLVLITNCTYPAWQKVSKFGSLFDKCFVSSVEGISKPDVRTWEIVESWFPEFPRNKFVMIGDNEVDDLAVPTKRGWETLPANEIAYGFKEEIVR